MEATGDLNTYSLARVMGTKPVRQRQVRTRSTQPASPTSSGVQAAGHESRGGCSALRGRNSFVFQWDGDTSPGRSS